MENERFDRQIRMFGADGQAKIQAQKVGIVGLGGLGSHIVQALTFLGVRSFVLVDEDRVEETNLNRLVGAIATDARNKTLKVEVAQRLIRSLDPEASIEPVSQDLRTKEAIDALTTCSTLFGCVDNDGARLILNDLAAAYTIPLVDIATEIDIQHPPLVTFGGRVVVARPGELCLICADVLDLEAAKQELENDLAKEIRRKHGYGLGEHVPAPAVISLNGTLANLAVTEYLMMVTGFRQPHRLLEYKGDKAHGEGLIVASGIVGSDPKCYTCGALLGTREAAGLYRYIKT